MSATTTGERDRPDRQLEPLAAPASAPAPTPNRHLFGYPVFLPKLRDVRLRVAVVTTSLHVLGQVFFAFNLSIAQILVTVGTAAVIEFVITFRSQRAIVWPASALLTGNSVALILRVPGTEPGDWWSMRGWYVFAGTAALAIGTKYLIRYRGKHVFNPSNVALVIVFIVLGEQRADPQVLWWGPWSVPIAVAFTVILAGSIAATMKVGHLRTAVTFWVPYSILMATLSFSGHAITTNWHVGPLTGWPLLATLTLSPEVLVFVFFMISDPKASATTPRGRLVFGFMIALASGLMVSTQTGEFGTKVAILAGLVVACPFVPWIDARYGHASSADGESSESGSTALRWFGKHPTEGPETGAVLGTGLIQPRPAKRLSGWVAVPLVVFGAVAAAIYLVGPARSFESESASQVNHLERRAEVDVAGLALPEIRIDGSAERSTLTISPELAKRVGTDVAHDLLIEAQALDSTDDQLVAAADSGTRLRQAKAALAAVRKGQTKAEQITYRFDSITATMFKRDSGPQTPPELAVRIVGEITLGSTPTPLDATYTVTKVSEVYLITNQFDPAKNPMPHPMDPHGETQAGGAHGIEPPVMLGRTEATAEQMQGLQMVDSAKTFGMDLPHARFDLGEAQNFRIGGAAVGDFDADGWPDIYLTRVGYPNVLYRNVEGTFVDVTASSGLATTFDGAVANADTPIRGGSTAAMFVDLDGDNRLDLIALGMPGTPNHLYLGQPDGTFVDRTLEWGFPAMADRRSGSISIGLAASDFDRDGHVDLFLLASEPGRIRKALHDTELSSKPCSDKAKTAVAKLAASESRTVLLRNTGSGFADATDRLGVDPSKLAGSSARFVDLNNDSMDDLVIGGSQCTSKVLINQGDRFNDATEGSGLDKVARVHGISVLDANGDGLLDLFTTGVSYPTESGRCPFVRNGISCDGNSLLINDGRARFSDRTDEFEVRRSRWGWGSAPSDLNNDSFADLFITNGVRDVRSWISTEGSTSDAAFYSWIRSTPDQLVLGQVGTPWPWANPNRAAWITSDAPNGDTPDASTTPPPSSRDGQPNESGVASTSGGRAVIESDFNRDGRVDLLVIASKSAPILLMNNTSNSNNWLEVALSDGGSHNTAAIGAVVTVRTTDGRTLTQRISAERSYQSAGEPVARFGLGERTSIDLLSIRWPNGKVQDLPQPELDRRMTVSPDKWAG